MKYIYIILLELYPYPLALNMEFYMPTYHIQYCTMQTIIPFCSLIHIRTYFVFIFEDKIKFLKCVSVSKKPFLSVVVFFKHKNTNIKTKIGIADTKILIMLVTYPPKGKIFM